MVNLAILLGNVGRDPEIKTGQSGNRFAKLSLATTRKYKGEKQTEWHNLIAFGKLVDVIDNYVHKGTPIHVIGRTQTRKWEKDGQTHYMTEVIVNDLTLLGDGNRRSRPTETVDDDFDDDFDDDLDDDLPF